MHGSYAASHVYHREAASETIVGLLASVELYTQKRFCDNTEASVRM